MSKNVNGIKIASIGLAEILNAKEIIILAKNDDQIKAISKLFSMTKYDSNFPLSSLLNASGKINFYSHLDFINYDNDLSITNNVHHNSETEISKKEETKLKLNIEKLERSQFSNDNKINHLDDDSNFKSRQVFNEFEEEDKDFRFHVVNEKAELLRRQKILRKKILVISEKANVLKIARMQYVDQVDKNDITKATVQIIDHRGKIKGYEEHNLLTRSDNPSSKKNKKPPTKKSNKKSLTKKNDNKSNNVSKQDSSMNLLSPLKSGTPPSIGD